MAIVQINGIDIHTMVLGDEGPLVFMLHGLMIGSVATWCFDFAPVLARNHRVVMFDMRGHGKSEQAISGYDVNTLATDLAELIIYYQNEFSLQNEAIHLVGHSYGAIVSLNYACQSAKRGWTSPASMIIIDAPLPAANFISPGLRELSTLEAVQAECQRLAAWLAIKPGRRLDKLQRHLAFLYLQSTLKDDLDKSDGITDELLQSVTCPVQLIYGQYSDCYPVGQSLLKRLDNANLTSFDCGHYITMEKPDALRQMMVQHFEGYEHGRW